MLTFKRDGKSWIASINKIKKGNWIWNYFTRSNSDASFCIYKYVRIIKPISQKFELLAEVQIIEQIKIKDFSFHELKL